MWTLARVICPPVAALSGLLLTTRVGREGRLPGNAAPTSSIDSDGKVCKDHQAAPTEAGWKFAWHELALLATP